MKISKRKLNRRDFMGGTLAAGAALSLQGCGAVEEMMRSEPNFVPADRPLRIAGIGVGGKGESDVAKCADLGEEIVALCDVDRVRAKGAIDRYKNARVYTDYREMLETEKDNIDAVIVSTPDHMHAVQTAHAIKLGKHVYTQKPLTHDIHEARVLRELARKHNIVSQMGNQGTALDGLRRGYEIVQDGVIGQVTEVHVWTNRPVWPQGSELTAPLPGVTVPPTMAWADWLGTAPARDYNPGYAPFKWRGWWDYGTGALGDMACHTANMPFMALELEYPTSVEAKTAPLNDQTFPDWSEIRFEFPARGKFDALSFTWYDGGKRPTHPLVKPEQMSNSGCLLVGTEGVLFSPNDYGAEFYLLPEEKFTAIQTKTPERLPSVPGNQDDNDKAHSLEWIQACKGIGTTMSDFDYAALLTETILLGNVAMKAGQPIEYDGKKMEIVNVPEANAYLKRNYAGGYTL